MVIDQIDIRKTTSLVYSSIELRLIQKHEVVEWRETNLKDLRKSKWTFSSTSVNNREKFARCSILLKT